MGSMSRGRTSSPRAAMLRSFTRSRILATRLSPASSTDVRYTRRANGQEDCAVDGEGVREGRGGREGGGRG